MGRGGFIILLGPPGAGKGTQAAALAQRLGAAHIASGDLFREALVQGTALGERARPYMEKGHLVPDDIAVAMVAERLVGLACGAILDGFPRTLPQARALGETLKEMGRAIDRVLYINVPEEAALQRLAGRLTCRQCGAIYHEVNRPPREAEKCDCCGGELYRRLDEKAETHRRRWQAYLEETAPLIDYYRESGLLVEINGQQAMEKVQGDLIAAVCP